MDQVGRGRPGILGLGLGAARSSSTYRFAIFSLRSGWLRPLMSLISFAISADIVERESGWPVVDDGPKKFFLASFAAAVSG